MGPFAQIAPREMAEGLGRDFLPWALGLVLVALAFVVRYVLELHRDRLASEKEHAKEMRELLMLVVPLSTKLTEALEIVERITARRSHEQEANE